MIAVRATRVRHALAPRPCISLSARARRSRLFWTEGRVVRLRTLWAEGKSTSFIASELGTTYDVVAGKAWRLGIKRKQSPRNRRDREWSGDDVAYLRAAWGRHSIAAIAVRLGKTPGAVLHRAIYVLSLPLDLGTGLPTPSSTHSIVKQDKAFCAAMRAAIAAGLENAPIGIDRRPCTRKPIFVPHGEVGP
jgi:GcrA cell cycle regulator